MEKADLPPPYEEKHPPPVVAGAPPYASATHHDVGFQQAGYQQAPYPPTSQPGYPPTSQPGYPISSQPGYPPSSQPGYPQSSQPGYPPSSQPGYPPTIQPGYGSAPHSSPGISHQQTTNTTVIMTGQPMGIPAQQTVYHEVPSNYMALSWIVCLFCCWPLGIAAIMASSRVDSAVAVGNIPYAQQQSRRAKNLAITAIVCGIVIYIIIVLRVVYFSSIYS